MVFKIDVSGVSEIKAETDFRSKQSGFVLPLVLLMVMTVGFLSASISMVAINTLRDSSLLNKNYAHQAYSDFVLQQVINIVRSDPLYWHSLPRLASLPSGYTSYSPLSLIASNGTPSCIMTRGVRLPGCERHLYPIGGGIIKNLGSITTGNPPPATFVDTRKSIVDQLPWDGIQPPPDFTFDNVLVWYQVERLQNVSPGLSTLGVTFGDVISSQIISFRVTIYSQGKLGSKVGRHVRVVLIDLPET
jgi:hypothetical protein